MHRTLRSRAKQTKSLSVPSLPNRKLPSPSGMPFLEQYLNILES